MALLTLAAAREKLWKTANIGTTYPGSATDRATFDGMLNEVIQTFIIHGKPRHTMRKVRIPIFDGNITLPRYLDSCSGVKLLAVDEDECCGSPLLIYSAFHEFFHGPCPACACEGAAYPATQLAQTFRDPEPGFTLRSKGTETGGNIQLVGGTDASDGEYFDTVQLAITNGTSNQARVFNTLPQIQKPETDNKVELYSVIAGAETLIAVYGPGETVPAYTRYTVTSEDSDAPACLAQCKLAFVPVSADTDIVYPGIIPALKNGLKAVLRENAEEHDQAQKWWTKGVNLLDLDRQQLDGDAAIPEFRVRDGVGFGDIAHTI